MKNPIEYSFVFFECFIIHHLEDWKQNCTLLLFEDSFVWRIHGKLVLVVYYKIFVIVNNLFDM